MTTINLSEDQMRWFQASIELRKQERRQLFADQKAALRKRFTTSTEPTDESITEQGQLDQQAKAPIDHIRSHIPFVANSSHVSFIANQYSREKAKEQAFFIAIMMGYTLVRVLSDSDLIQIYEKADTEALSREDMFRLLRADLVLEVTDQEKTLQFISVEASAIANRHDIDRARRNAGYLTQFTGKPAHIAIASERYTQDIQNMLDTDIWWYPLKEKVTRTPLKDRTTRIENE